MVQLISIKEFMDTHGNTINRLSMHYLVSHASIIIPFIYQSGRNWFKRNNELKINTVNSRYLDFGYLE